VIYWKEEILKLNVDEFQEIFTKFTNFKQNPFHPLVWISGKPKIGKNVSIGFLSELNAKESKISIGDNCDIASFVAINCADSHKKCIEIKEKIERNEIILENNVFVGSHSVIKGGVKIGHHSVIAAGTIMGNVNIPPYSLVYGNPTIVKEGYYLESKKK
jgi:acetyltransferase-like isoleucine patch superfamily enzyme